MHTKYTVAAATHTRRAEAPSQAGAARRLPSPADTVLFTPQDWKHLLLESLRRRRRPKNPIVRSCQSLLRALF